jgi:hypothetical protein
LRWAFIDANPDGVIGNFSDIGEAVFVPFARHRRNGQGQVLSQLGWVESQPAPVPSSQSPTPAVGSGHTAIWQSSPASQSTSHSHDSKQLTTSHALMPLHVTSHAPGPHCTLPQALEPSQVTAHAVESEQSMSSQALLLVQLISHANPAGQVT